MKQFNQTINIEVAVDSIAQTLLDTMSPDYKHREIVTEAIIATALDRNTLSFIFNALNGHVPHLNFNVGESVICTSTYWNNGKSNEIGICRIVEVNPYVDAELKVEYTYVDGEKTHTAKQWVRSNRCDRVPVEEASL